MKKEKILNYMSDRQMVYYEMQSVVSKLELKKIYKFRYAYKVWRKDFKGWDYKFSGFIGQVIAFNNESVRIKVIAADQPKEQYGRTAQLSCEKEERTNRRRDTISIKYELLTIPGCSIDTVTQDDLVTNIGHDFIHRDFRKHLEEA